jgi:hypothetical protein
MATIVREDDQLAILLNSAGMGAAPLPDGEILVKITDAETGMSAYTRYTPEKFGEIIANFQQAMGRRIVTVEDEEIKKYGNRVDPAT